MDIIGGDPCNRPDCKGLYRIKTVRDGRQANPQHQAEGLYCSACGKQPKKASDA